MKQKTTNSAAPNSPKKQSNRQFPSVRWFEDNGTPLKKVNVSPEDVSTSSEDRGIIALATHSIAEKRITLMTVIMSLISIFVVLELVCVALYIHSSVVWDKYGVYADWLNGITMIVVAVFAAVPMILGCFLMPRCYRVFKGFLAVNGAEQLGMSPKQQRIIRDLCRLSLVWGIIPIAVQWLIHKRKRLIQIALPEYCGFDLFIEQHCKKKKRTSPPDKPQKFTSEQCAASKGKLLSVLDKVRAGENWCDEYTTQRSARLRRLKISDLYPGVKWFKERGTPIKEIRMPYEVIENMSEDELDMVSVSTFALVERRIKLINSFLIMLAIGLLVTIIGAIVTTCTASFGTGLGIIIFGLLAFFGVLLVGSIFMIPCYRILTAFLYIDGDTRLMLDYINYRRRVKIYEIISFVWAIVLIFVLTYMGGSKATKDTKYIPHIGMPEHCGYDNLIALSEKIESVSVDAFLNALQDESNERQHEQYVKKLDDILSEIKSDKILLEKDKEELSAQIQEKIDEDKTKYDAAQASLAEQYEQEISPAYESLQQEMVAGDESGSLYAQTTAQYVKSEIGEWIIDQHSPQRIAEKEVAATAPKISVISICLSVACCLCILAGVIAFFVVHDGGSYNANWGYLFIPYLLAGVLAIVGLIVKIKTSHPTAFKRIYITALSLFICLTLFSIAAAMRLYAPEGTDSMGGFAPPSSTGGLSYLYDNDGSWEITGCDSGAKYLTIPSSNNGKPVKGIADGAFSGQTSLERVTITDGMVYIGSDAFEYCINLTRITIPNSVTRIGETFETCDSLTEIIYLGTTEQWSEIEKSGGNDNITIHCSDGDCWWWGEPVVAPNSVDKYN